MSDIASFIQEGNQGNSSVLDHSLRKESERQAAPPLRQSVNRCLFYYY